MDSYQIVLAAPGAPGAPESPDAGDRVRTPPPALVPGSPALIIDVLRATTTLTMALRHGAVAVLEAATIAEAFALKEQHPDALLCGEREGRVIPGFDLANSPFEYTRERVGGRTLVFASTNGSQALRLARGRRRVLTCFANLAAAIARVRDARDVAIVCSGKLGGFALEDAACAGLAAARLEALGAKARDRASVFARALAPADADETRRLVEGAAHARYLRTLGPAFARDVGFCAQLDVLDTAFEV